MNDNNIYTLGTISTSSPAPANALKASIPLCRVQTRL